MKAIDLVQRIESKCAPTIVDVRFRSEFEQGHVPGAVNTPFFAPKVAKLPKDRSSELVIYCGHGQRAWIAQQLPGPAWLSKFLSSRRTYEGLESGRPALGKVEPSSATEGTQ